MITRLGGKKESRMELLCSSALNSKSALEMHQILGDSPWTKVLRKHS